MPGAEHPCAIGSDTWPGVAKAVEEAGELGQVLGKIVAFPFLKEGELHPDGRSLVHRLEDEIGDVQAILEYIIVMNGLNTASIVNRRNAKLDRFKAWDVAERTRRFEADQTEGATWAKLLLQRDGEQGRRVLERMVAWYNEHDGRADDFGEFFIVKDAKRALEASS